MTFTHWIHKTTGMSLCGASLFGARQQRCPGCKLLKVWTAPPKREVKWP